MPDYNLIFETIQKGHPGDPTAAYKAAKQEKLPDLACEFLALWQIWTVCSTTFRDLCERISKDTGLPVFIRAYALVSAGDTLRRRDERSLRNNYYDRAMRLASVADMPRQQFERIRDLCEAGRTASATTVAI